MYINNILNPLFKITTLNCSYSTNSRAVLSIEDIILPKGVLIFIVGVSGGGKSTLLETLGMMNRTIQSGSSLLFYDSDNMEHNLFDLWSKDDEYVDAFRRKNFSFIFQKTNLMNNFTCGENMLLPALFKGQSYNQSKKKVYKYMKILGLPSDIFNNSITTLSGGQRQRLAFIRAMVSDFTVLFGDEPTGNLDYSTSDEMMKVLKSHLFTFKKTGIIVSHNLELAVRFGDMIIPIEIDKTELSSKGFVKKENLLYRDENHKWKNNSVNFIDATKHLKSIIS